MKWRGEDGSKRTWMRRSNEHMNAQRSGNGDIFEREVKLEKEKEKKLKWRDWEKWVKGKKEKERKHEEHERE